MDRVSLINDYATNKKNEEINKKREAEKRINKMLYEIEKLRPRMLELLKVGQACENNGISLKAFNFNFEKYEHNHFISNSWSHLTGFTTNFDNFSVRRGEEFCHQYSMDWKKRIGGFGKIGGGVCNYNLTILVDEIDTYVDIVVTGDKEYVLNAFLKDFDTFESKFYEYVDKTCKGEENV